MINKSILLIKKVFLLMDTWIVVKDLMKHYYLIKKPFCSELYLEGITDKNYTHAQKYLKNLNLKT